MKGLISVIKGDITLIEKGVLVNGVNCQNRMGAGVAKAYFTKWPQVKHQYHTWDNEMHLGKFDPVCIKHNELYVANCWTQEFFGYDGKPYADLGAILASISQAAMFARKKQLPLYTPWVGCGLGGLEKDQVESILLTIQQDCLYTAGVKHKFITIIDL